MDRLTIVIAAHDEAQSLPALHARLLATMARVPGLDGRILYVDDGSGDETWSVMRRLASEDERVALLRLSRNFGKEAALTAGLDHVGEGAALIMDADGQDPPELIPQFIALWRQGYDDVYGTRIAREGESWLKRTTASLFYRLMGRLSKTPIPADTGDFRLLSPRVLEALAGMRERHRFMKGLFGWVGFRRVALAYRREPRLAGRSKFGFWRLWNFAMEGITSFSTAPLRAATYLGLATASLAFLAAAWIVIKAAFWGDPVAGWPTMMVVILFLGGVQLIALGLIGEYLGRLYEESKQRPLYLVERWQPAATEVCSVRSPQEGGWHAHGTSTAGGEGA